MHRETETLQELLTFLYAECCTRNKAISPETIVVLRSNRSQTHKENS